MERARSGRYEFILVTLLILFWGGVGLNRIGLGFIFPQIKPEFHMQNWEAALLISGTSVTWAISSWVGGWLSDRYGRRRVLLPAAAFVCLMTAAMGGTWGFLSMFIVRDLLGIGDGIGWSVGESTIGEESAPHRRGLNQALFSGGYTLIGAGLGALIITNLTAHLGWRWVFPIIGAGTAVVVLALALVMREPLAHVKRHKTDWHSAIGLLRNRSLVYVIIMGCAILTWLQSSVGFNHLFLIEVKKFGASDAGTIASAWGFAGTVGCVVVPLASDFWGRRPAVLVSAIVGAVSLTAYLTGGFGMTGMTVLLGISGFCGFGLLPVVLATCVTELVSEDVRGAALGVTNFFGVIVGTTLMPIVAGIIADAFGVASAIWVPISAFVVVAVFILAIKETAPRVVMRKAAAAAQ